LIYGGGGSVKRFFLNLFFTYTPVLSNIVEEEKKEDISANVLIGVEGSQQQD
jgi:hypothetical protein